jgi:hypothetical protein
MLTAKEQELLARLTRKAFGGTADAKHIGQIFLEHSNDIATKILDLATKTPSPDLRLKGLKIVAEMAEEYRAKYFAGDPAVVAEILALPFDRRQDALLRAYTEGVLNRTEHEEVRALIDREAVKEIARLTELNKTLLFEREHGRSAPVASSPDSGAGFTLPNRLQ